MAHKETSIEGEISRGETESWNGYSQGTGRTICSRRGAPHVAQAAGRSQNDSEAISYGGPKVAYTENWESLMPQNGI